MQPCGCQGSSSENFIQRINGLFTPCSLEPWGSICPNPASIRCCTTLQRPRGPTKMGRKGRKRELKTKIPLIFAVVGIVLVIMTNHRLTFVDLESCYSYIHHSCRSPPFAAAVAHRRRRRPPSPPPPPPPPPPRPTLKFFLLQTQRR